MKIRRILCIVLAVVMLLSFAACGQKKEEPQPAQPEAPKDPIQIATKPMTEQYVLGEMLGILIEETTDYTVEITKGIGGGTNNIHPAMVSGDFDLYPEYTSSGWVMVLKHAAGEVSDEEMFELLKKEYHEQFGMTWVGLYGFNNTYAVVVRGEVAREYGLKSCSDLAAVSDKLVFGGNADYQEREDGFPALCKTYGFNFKNVMDIDIGLKYAALENAEIDVTNGFTTDAKLGSADVVALEDDKNLQVNYFASTIVREDTLAEYPGLEDALMKMDGILTDVEMATLSSKVEAGEDEHAVALEYLQSKGII